MCLTLYMATTHDQPLRESRDLSVRYVEGPREAVRQWFSWPTVRVIGAHTGCGCGFPSIKAEAPVGYFDDVFDVCQDRDADLRSVQSLLGLIREHVVEAGEVELYPVWGGEEGRAPKGTITVRLDALVPETFFFNEQFLYRVTRTVDGTTAGPER